jgi:hypothetical protein
VLVHTSRPTSRDVSLHCIGGERNDRDAATPIAHLADMSRRGDPVHFRHLNVHKHHVEVSRLDGGNGFGAVLHEYHLMPGVGKDRPDILSDPVAILGHENASASPGIYFSLLCFCSGLGSSFHAGDREPERAAGTAPAVDADRATHRLHQMSRDGGTKTGTTELAVGGLDHLRKRPKQQMLLRADPRIGDLEAELSCRCTGRSHHTKNHHSAIGKLNGVQQKVQ